MTDATILGFAVGWFCGLAFAALDLYWLRRFRAARATLAAPTLPVQTFTDAELYDIDQALQTAHVRLPLRGKVMQTLGLSGVRGSA